MRFRFRLLSLTPGCLALGCLFGFGPAAAKPPLPENSLYHLETVWERDDGKPRRLEELRGKVRIVSMFFSHCSNICPMLLGQLKKVEQSLTADLRDRVGFVLISLDSEADSSGALAAYRREVNLPPERWILAHGSADDTRELANLLGVQFTPKKEDGQIDHTGLIVILDAEGRILEKTSSITDGKAFLKTLATAQKKD